VAILGEGATSRESSRQGADTSQTEKLQQQAREAARILGVADVRFGGLPDNRFDALDLLDIVKVVEALIGQGGPDVVLTHHSGDLNVDHELTHRSVLTATRPVSGQTVTDLYTFETVSATEWAFDRLRPPFRPSVFVDVTESLERKLAAMAVYAGELRAFPHPRSSEQLRVTARRWGGVSGLEWAEAFELVRSIRGNSRHALGG
jgi:LmbE family N-acetylglucosaminyl deacetylase